MNKAFLTVIGLLALPLCLSAGKLKVGDQCQFLQGYEHKTGTIIKIVNKESAKSYLYELENIADLTEIVNHFTPTEPLNHHELQQSFEKYISHDSLFYLIEYPNPVTSWGTCTYMISKEHTFPISNLMPSQQGSEVIISKGEKAGQKAIIESSFFNLFSLQNPLKSIKKTHELDDNYSDLVETKLNKIGVNPEKKQKLEVQDNEMLGLEEQVNKIFSQNTIFDIVRIVPQSHQEIPFEQWEPYVIPHKWLAPYESQ